MLDKLTLPTIWDVPEDLWQKIQPLLPPEKRPGTPGRPAINARMILNGILYVMRTGCQWNAVPREFGSGSTLHRLDVAPALSAVGRPSCLRAVLGRLVGGV